MDMDPHARPQPQRSEAWRPLTTDGQSRRTRRLYRLLISAAFLALAAIFLFVLFIPFNRPKTVWIGGWIDYSAQVPNARIISPLDIAYLRRFMPNDNANGPVPGTLLAWTNDNSLTSWQEFVDPLVNSSDEVAIIYLHVQGIVIDKHAEILQNGFRPSQTEAARLSVSSLLTTLQGLPQRVKLLVLEAGHIAADRALGVADNRFAEEVRRAVIELGDPSIWVFLSHQSGERAWVSPVLQQSVFTHFVTEGLLGKADNNRDSTVTVGELASFVVPRVEKHVRTLSRNRDCQTPLLLCGDALRLSHSTEVRLLYLASISDRSTQSNPNTLVSALSWIQLAKAAGSATTKQPSPALTPAPNAQTDPSSTAPPTDREKVQREKRNRDRQSAAQTLMRAWQLRDRIANLPVANAIAYEPHRWRAFQQQLLGLEQRLRLDTEASWADVAWELEQTCDYWESTNLPVEPAVPPAKESVNSTATPQAAGANSNPATSEKLDAAAAWTEYQSRWKTTQSKEFRAWLQHNAQPDWQENEHLAWPVELAVNSLVDDDLFAIALETRQCASDLAVQGKAVVDWCYPQWLTAERQRQLGEQHLRDYATPRRCELAREALAQSLSSYNDTAARLRIVADARHLYECLMSRAPDYLDWFARGQNNDGLWAPRFDDLVALFERLRDLADMFNDDSNKSFTSLQQTVAQLALLQDIVERPLADDAIAHLVEPEKAATHFCEIETLLSTSLPSAKSRAMLLDAIEVGRKRWGNVTSESPSSARDVKRHELHNALRIARLQLGLTLLATSSNSEQRNRLTSILERVDRTCTELRIASSGDDADSVRVFNNVLLDSESQATTVLDSESQATAVLEAASAAQRDAYHELIKRCDEIFLHSNGDDYRTVSSSYAELHRALYVIDPRDIVPPLDGSLASFAVQLAEYEAISLRYTSQRLMGYDLSGTDHDRWSAHCEELRDDAMRVFSSPVLPLPGVEPLQLDGPRSLSLLRDPQQQVTLLLKGITPSSGPVWIVLDYDDTAIDAAISTSLRSYRSDSLAWSTTLPPSSQQNSSHDRGSLIDRPHHLANWKQALLSLPPSLVASSGETIQLPLSITRRENCQGPMRLVVRVITNDSLARHAIDVQLPGQPPVHVTVQGIEGTVSDSAMGPRLHPWPNRSTEYIFTLQNRTAQARTIDATFYALPAELPATQAAALLQPSESEQLTPDLGNQLATFTGIQLPAGGHSPLPWQKHTAKLPSVSTKAPTAAVPSVPPVNGKAIASAPPEIPGDLLCMIVDTTSGERWYQPIELTVQRPRNYVSVQASYDAATNTVLAVVRANDVTTLPPKGILVRGYFLGQEEGTPVQNKSLQAVLQAPSGEVRLRGTIPKSAHDRRYFFVDVDDFPRAFILEIPRSPTQTDVPEAWDYAAIQIEYPEPRDIVGEPHESIETTLRVDAPPGMLAQPGNSVEISLDVQRDRNSSNDSVKRLRSDRLTQTWLLETAPNGRLVCHSSVTDLKTTIPTIGVRNVRAMVRASMQLNDQLVRAEPVEIIFDGKAPDVTEVRVFNPKMVPRGLAAQALISTDDHQLSGVAKVEAMWDLQQTGEFPPSAPTILGTHEAGVGWHLTLPATELALGQQTLLVRATDHAGNVSPTATAAVEVVDPELLKRMPVVVRGKVLYEGKAAAEADVEISDEMGKALPKVTTAADGSFEVPGVIPGNYSISAAIYVRNLPRRTTRKLIVAPIYEVAKPITLPIP